MDGIGNIPEAKRWLNSAAELGHTDAITGLEDLERDKKINRLEKQIELAQALSAIIAVLVALAFIIFHSSISSKAKAILGEIFLGTVSFSLCQILLDAFYILPVMSSITMVMGFQIIFALAVYFIIKKYLSLVNFASSENL